MPMSYLARVRSEAQLNPGLSPLLQFLSQDASKPSQKPSQIKFIEHPKTSKAQNLAEDHANLHDILARIENAARTPDEDGFGCTLMIEDIQPSHIEYLGESLSIDPVFFAGYLGTDYRAVEQHALPLWATTLPSESATQKFCHLHYQRAVKLERHLKTPPEKTLLVSATNVPRAVKRLTTLSGVDVALARTCISVLRKCFESGFWICLIIMDSTTAKVVPQASARYGVPTFVASQTPLHGPVRLEKRLVDMSLAQVALQGDAPLLSSEFDCLVACITRENTLSTEKPSMISLCLNPLRLVLREFLVYSITMNRYVRYYEYSLKDLDLSVREGDLNDLQIWRRRAFQTLQRLFAMQSFVEHWNTKERPPEEPGASLGAWLIKDIQHLITVIEHHSRSLETMIPVTTAMVQLADVRRSTEEASHVKQLTYLALVFIPLSFVASLFSMSDKVAPWSRNFWLYFVVAVPLLLFVLIASWLMPFRGHTTRHKQKMR